MFNKFLKARLFIQVTMVSFFATLAAIGLVAAATTIGTDINTGGTLTVTGTTATSTFSTGGLTIGTNQFVVQQSSGNIGIGTTGPQAARLSVLNSNAAEAVMELQSTSATGYSAIDYYDNSGNWVGYTGYGNPSAAYSVNDKFFISALDKDIMFNAGAGGSTFVIKPSGNVGIGTTTPNNLLSVYQLIDFNNTDFNTKIGYQAGLNIVSGANKNTYIGYQAGTASSTASTNAAVLNTAVGYRSFYSNTTGLYNVVMGALALYRNTTGDANSAIGSTALYLNTTGGFNSALGSSALYFNTTGSYNTGSGESVLYRNTTGSYNTANGELALFSNTTGASSTAMGYGAGYSNTTGSNNIIIGFNTDLPAVNSSNMLSIGNLIYATGLTAFTDHSSNVSTGNVGIGTSSPLTKLSIQGTAGQPVLNVASSTGASLLYVNESGNVGIGTTTPGYKLTVNSTDGTTNLFQVATTTNQGIFVINSSGQVGIGTASLGTDFVRLYDPDGNLSFKGTIAGSSNEFFAQSVYNASTGEDGVRFALYNGSGAGKYWSIGTGLVGRGQASGATGKFFIGDENSGGAARLIIDSSGNVGIGTSSPYSKLSVWGSGTGATSLFELTNSASTTLMTVLNNGNVGISTTTPAATLDINGYMKLKMNTSQPVACGTNNAGSIALNSLYAICVCNGSGWINATSTQACSW